jgi:uncharacterized BrkB/YihY/UPF0761 family membrane protein
MGLLLWIYYSGVILLLGGCMAATIHGPRAVKHAERLMIPPLKPN